jgi:hypothetical protein
MDTEAVEFRVQTDSSRVVVPGQKGVAVWRPSSAVASTS